ncbi:hypothetical protein [Streptomyces sp. NPDC001933]|uniref:hypothetical protein n=1 Tax=Streptomyces sp. NPDC001933 TaxID=3364626 RepID=UPI00367A0DE4
MDDADLGVRGLPVRTELGRASVSTTRAPSSTSCFSQASSSVEATPRETGALEVAPASLHHCN